MWAGLVPGRQDLHVESVRSGSWRPDLIITNICHYLDGPVHQLFSATNECGGCHKILEALHRQRFGPDCQCWWRAREAYRAAELAEVGSGTDCSDDISFIDEDIPLMVRRSTYLVTITVIVHNICKYWLSLISWICVMDV